MSEKNVIKLFEGRCEQILKGALEDVDEIDVIICCYRTKEGAYVGIWDGDKGLESLGLAAYMASLIPSSGYGR